jgi:predicted RNA binding protein YcfA (HicA-like mRNA interferase family)
MTGKDLVKKLQKEGWIIDRINSSHHIMKKDIKTVSVPVHGNRDLPNGTMNQILKTAGLKGGER